MKPITFDHIIWMITVAADIFSEVNGRWSQLPADYIISDNNKRFLSYFEEKIWFVESEFAMPEM